MATLQAGYTFGTTEQVTAAKLSALVSSGSVGSIANADIASNAAIAYSKLSLTSSIATGDLAASCVTSAAISAGVLVSSHFAASSLPSAGFKRFSMPLDTPASGASGAVLYRNASGILADLAPPSASGVYLQMAAASVPAWAAISAFARKSGTFTRAANSATGARAITGVGFSPKLILLLTAVDGGSAGSIGFYDGTNSYGILNGIGAKWYKGTAQISRAEVSTGNTLNYVGSSLDADGFTITSDSQGTPGATDVDYFWLALA